ncbi:MAG TPA: M48 family metalloprotease [Casimicrobiaceae bacterium]|nr:M48 family metalloprotease [Casimicrobiaceae bacterium]
MRLAAACALLVALPALGATLDPAALDQGGDIAYRRAIQPAVDARRLNADRGIALRVRGELNRILVGAPAIDPGARTMHWTVNVATDPVAEVLAFPGGRLLVHTGLVTGAGLSDEEQAAIIAHVVAHSLLGEDRRRLEGAVRAEDAAAADPNRRALAVAGAVEVLSRRYDAPAIEAADRAGVELLARAAYTPRAAASAWRKLADKGSPLAARYPVTPERLAALEAAADKAMPLYQDTAAKAAQMQRERGSVPGPTRSIR